MSQRFLDLVYVVPGQVRAGAGGVGKSMTWAKKLKNRINLNILLLGSKILEHLTNSLDILNRKII